MDKEIQKKFAEYVKRRGHARGALTRLENSVTSFASDKMDLQDAYAYLEQLERCYRDFEEFDQKMSDIDADSSETEDLEQNFLKLKAKLRGVVHNTNPLLTAVQKQLDETMTSFNSHQKELLNTIRETGMAAVPKESTKLPPIDILPFYGNRAEEFQSFKDLFETIVDKNQVMSDCQKLCYLKGLLKGDAYTFVRHLAVTDAYYKGTWEKVCKRYDQPILVIRSFIKRFLEQPSISNTNLQSLRKALNTSTEIIAGLKVLGEHAETRDIWINYILTSKLDEDSGKAWSAKSVDVKYSTFESLIDFLEKRCAAFENCEITNRRSTITKPNYSINSHHAVTLNSSATTNQLVSQESALPRAVKCCKCAKNHRLQDCEQFKSMNVTNRKELVASSGYCFNCLTDGHSSKVCRSFRRCQLCRRKHHTMLHPPEEPFKSQTEGNVAKQDIQPGEIMSDVSITPSKATQVKKFQNNHSDATDLHLYASLLPSPLLPTTRVIIRK